MLSEILMQYVWGGAQSTYLFLKCLRKQNDQPGLGTSEVNHLPLQEVPISYSSDNNWIIISYSFYWEITHTRGSDLCREK